MRYLLSLLIAWHYLNVVQFNPAIFLLVLNAMLTGTVAAVIAADQVSA